MRSILALFPSFLALFYATAIFFYHYIKRGELLTGYTIPGICWYKYSMSQVLEIDLFEFVGIILVFGWSCKLVSKNQLLFAALLGIFSFSVRCYFTELIFDCRNH